MLHSEYMSENVAEEKVDAGSDGWIDATYSFGASSMSLNGRDFGLITTPGDGGRVWNLTTTNWLVGHVAGNGVTLTVDLSVIHDYLAASGVSSVTMVVDVDHEQHVVRGTISDDELTFHLPIYRGDQGRPVTLYDCDICPASYVRTVEYANPMRMVLTQ